MLKNPRHEQFAQRVAGGASATRAYIAAGYTEAGAAQSAARLLRHVKVRERVKEIKKAISDRLTDCSIRHVDSRIQALQDRWERMQRVIEARAADPDIRKAPGGETGLLGRSLKSIGRGEDAEIVEEFEVDTGLLRELRAHEEQAARELGQWAEKHEHTGTVNLVARLNAGRDRLRRRTESA